MFTKNIKRVLFLLAMVILVVGGCVSGPIQHQRFQVGDIVQHVTSGRQGQVLDGYCYAGVPCEYYVRFPLEYPKTESTGLGGFSFGQSGGGGLVGHSSYSRVFAEEYVKDFELNPVGGPGPAQYGPTRTTSPVISNLSYSPTSVVQGAGGGVVTVTGTLDFTDPDGDVISERGCVDTCPTGGPRICQINRISGAMGLTSGVIKLSVPVQTTGTPGVYGGDFTVIDSKGLESNTLQVSFTITEP